MPNLVRKTPQFKRGDLKQELSARPTIPPKKNGMGFRKMLAELSNGLKELRGLRSRPIQEKHIITRIETKAPAASTESKREAIPFYSKDTKGIPPDIIRTAQPSIRINPINPKAELAEAKRVFLGSTSSMLRHQVPFKRVGTKAVTSVQKPNEVRVPSSTVVDPMTPKVISSSSTPKDGMDKEAKKHLTEVRDSKKVSHIPSAARLAQIVRANEAYKKDTGKTHPQLQSYVDRIEKGDRRSVADIPADAVSRVINSALGGENRAAQIINTPEVTRMIDRHSTLVNTLQLERSERAKRAKTYSNKHNTVISSGSTHSSGTSVVNNHDDRKSSNQSLNEMLVNNEESHINKFMAEERAEPYSRAHKSGDRVLNVSKQSTNPIHNHNSTTVKHGNAVYEDRKTVELSSRDGTAPKGNAAKLVGEAVSKDRKSHGRQLIEGTLKMTSINGQNLGQATLNGEIR